MPSIRENRDRLLTPRETAERLNLKNVDTLSVWRSTKRYPLTWIKIGRLVRYRESDVEKFIEQSASLHCVLNQMHR